MDAPAWDPLLQVLAPEARPLAALGQIRRFRSDTLIIHEGAAGDAMYFLLQGSVLAFSSDEDGNEVNYAVHSAGAFFGEMVLDGGPRAASVKALEPVVCAVVACDTVWQHVQSHPEFARHFIERLIGRARNTTEQARAMALLNVYGRVRLLLHGMVGTQPLPHTIAGKLTHQAIGNRIGASREMVTRLINDLDRKGFLTVEHSRITLLVPLPDRL